MAKKYPTIGEYNQLIQKNGGHAFRTLNGINLIPSRTSPIKVYLFGSGAYAAVFKGSINDSNYAIRCFLTADDETINRYKTICNHLKSVQSEWKTDCEFLDNEIRVNGTLFPILKMDWLNGVLINQFVSNNISDNHVLNELQKKLIAISDDLEKNNIGHGDLQCGNIIISGTSANFQIKLIDYDGMYVPDLENEVAMEKGRSEFQHPKRTLNNFNPQMDRFSFWVFITAIEALKIDKTLWREVMQGGYNTLDNFLFTFQDFVNPNQSSLFNRLYKLNSSVLNFYLDKLKAFCLGDYHSITKPDLFSQVSNSSTKRDIINPTNIEAFDKKVRTNKYKIISNISSASVLTSTFQKLGFTPLEIEKSQFEGKVILVSNGKYTQRIMLNSNQNLVKVHFD